MRARGLDVLNLWEWPRKYYETKMFCEIFVIMLKYQQVFLCGNLKVVRGILFLIFDFLKSSFDFVNEFNIFGSLFDRASMWGFKVAKCGEFNILGGSRFYR
jgi:hypothetical protein